MRILFLLLMSGLACAASYPDRPITIIVPFAEGSDTDQFAHNFTRHVAKYLGNATFQFKYIPGDSGVKATQYLLSQPADGYTLMEGRVSYMVIAPKINKSLGYQWDSFGVLGIKEILPLVCSVRTDSPYRNVRDLLNAIRQKPGQIKYGTSGSTTVLNFSVQYLLHIVGLPSTAAQQVIFESSPQVMAGLVDGRVDFVCNNALTQVPLIEAGKLRGLFTTASGRMTALPAVPNAREVGLRDMTQVASWTALAGPGKLPDPVVVRWRAALAQLAQDKQWQASSMKLGGLPALDSIPDTTHFLRTQNRLYEQLVMDLAGPQ